MVEKKESINKKDISSTQDIANILKETRLQKKITLQGVAKDIKIRTAFLEYIESNTFDKLPGRIYVIGFIRTYSAYLGLDENLLISELKCLPDFVLSETNKQGINKISVKKSENSYASIVTAFFLILGLFFFLSYIMKKDDNNSLNETILSRAPTQSLLLKNAEESDKKLDGITFQ